MKTIKQLLEQHREEGRFSPTIPRAPKNKGIGPRKSVDSANAKLKEDTEHPELKKIRDEYEKREGKGSFDKQTHKWSDDPHRSIWGDRLVSDYKSKKHQLELKKEDVELEESIQIDEISKQTLGSYIKKASHDVATKGALTRHFAEKGQREKDSDNWIAWRKSNATADKIFKKSWKRREGMAKAVDRLTKEEVYSLGEGRVATDKEFKDAMNTMTKMPEFSKMSRSMKRRDQDEDYNTKKNKDFIKDLKKEEVEQLTELSPETKTSYLQKAKSQVKELKPWTKKGEYKDLAKRMISRREKGISRFKEEVEELDEMSGAGMSTRDVHKHLKKSGWQLARTKGGHDVFTHPKSKNNIAVPRHRGDLKAPTVLGIMKAAKIEEAENSMMADTSRINLYADDPSRPSVESPRKAKQVKEEIAGWVAHYNGKKHEIQKHEAKDLWNAKQKAIEHFKVPKSKHGLVAIKPGYNEETEINESRKIEIVREAIKKAKEKKEVKDKFEAEPELTSQIIK